MTETEETDGSSNSSKHTEIFAVTVPTREHYTPTDVDYTEKNELQLSLLTEEQRALLDSFLERVRDDYPNDVRDLSQVVKFLEAKYWNLDKSEDLFRKKFEWVKTFQPHRITEDEVADKLTSGKVFIRGRDKHGRPILVIRSCNAYPIGPTEYDQEMLRKSFAYMAELAFLNLPPPPYNQMIIISDRKYHRRRNSDTKALRIMFGFADHYPEMLSTMFVMHANWIFTTLVRIAKTVLDSRTINKLVFLSDPKEMRQYVDAENLFADHGGLPDEEDICPTGYLPTFLAESLARGHKKLNPANPDDHQDLVDMN